MKRLVFLYLLYTGGIALLHAMPIAPQALTDSIHATLKTYDLPEITVRSSKIKRNADRFIMQVTPSSGKNGIELLKEAPGVWLSDKGISINGASGAKVYINGQEVRLEGELLHFRLQSLQSADIQRIEILPFSGAEKDANAQGGAVYILLRKPKQKGWQGHFSLMSTTGHSVQQYQPNGSWHAHWDKWDWYASASITWKPEDASDWNEDRIYRQTGKQFQSTGARKQTSDYETFRSGIIFSPDTLNTFGLEVEYFRHSSDNPSHSRDAISNRHETVYSHGNYHQKSDYDMTSVNFSYQHRLSHSCSTLKILADYTGKHAKGKNRYNILRQAEDYKKDTLYRSQTKADYRIINADVSWNSKSFQTGAKYTQTYTDNTSAYEGFRSGTTWTPLPDFGYTRDYREQIAAWYAQYTFTRRKWTVKAGLRLEYTHTSNRENNVNQRYFDWFPHMDVSYAFDPLQHWMLAGQYGRYIERPAFAALNPNRTQTSDYSYQIGNPWLKPTYINRFSLTLIYKYRYTLTIGGNLHKNLIREFTKQDEANPDIAYVTYENHHRENHWFVAISAPWQPTGWLNLTANFIGSRQDIYMNPEEERQSHWLYFIRAQAECFLPWDLSLEMKYSGTSRLHSGNSEINPYHTADIRLQKKFNQGKWILTLGIDNLFDRSSSYACHTEDYERDIHIHTASQGRTWKIGIAWNFGKGKQAKKTEVEKGKFSQRNRLAD